MKPLKSLIVEDSKDDATLLLHHLSKVGYQVQSTIVQTPEEMKAALAERDWDIILSDYVMPHFSGLDALTMSKESGLDIPFIIISGTIGEDVAVEAMLFGAQDYLLKGNLTLLAPAIEREIQNAASRRAQQQAEEALRRSEASLANAQRIAHIGSWECDVQNNNRLVWSDETYRIFDLSKSQFDNTYEDLFTRIHPEDRELVQSVVDKAFLGNTPYSIEHRIVRPNGEVRMVCEVGEIKFDESGKPLSISGTVQDITERKRAERITFESENKYRNIVETANEGIWLFSNDGVTTYVNRQMTEMLGYSADEMLGRPILDFIFEEDLSAAKREIVKRRRENSETSEFRLRRKDGSEIIILFNASPTKDQDGKIVGFLSMNSDITERKRAEAAVRKVEARYRSLIESSPGIVYLNEPSPPYSTVYVSPNVTKYGYSPEEWYAVPGMWTSVMHPEDRERVLREFEFAAQQGVETELEYRIVARDGKTYWWQDKGRFILDEQGNRTGWQGIILDVTVTKGLEEQLRQSQKLESVGLLAGGIAHDFNNMLTAINGYSDLLLRQLKAEDPLRHNIEEIKKAGLRSAALTYQLLAFSRQQFLQPVVTDLNEAIADITKMLHRLISEDIQLITILNPKVGRVIVDPGQFSQIVMNLVVNARDAMPQGGMLTIETANIFLEPAYTQRHLDVLPGAYVLIAVSDTGTGMSGAIQQHIFEPFFTTKKVGQGTGLGLSTVYGIVKQSRGNIEVYSEEGIGTTFKIYLPRVMEEVAAPGETKDAAPEMIEGTERILLVEDEELVRNLTRKILEICGYTVFEARNGVEALEIFVKEGDKFDLLLTDVVMPQMGGRELAEKLQARLPNLRVLFASGYTDDAILQHNLIEINADFIQKPFTFDDLAQKVRQLLDAKTSESDT